MFLFEKINFQITSVGTQSVPYSIKIPLILLKSALFCQQKKSKWINKDILLLFLVVIKGYLLVKI